MDRDRREYMSVAAARAALGVSKSKMAKLIHDGVLPTVPDPLDARSKLILRSIVARFQRAAESSEEDDSPKTRAA
jgi:hypothetical protein